MAKIPVGATIVHAYRFGFSRFPAILGIMWVPWLLMTLATFLTRSSILAMMRATLTRDFILMQGQWGPFLLFCPVIMALLSMQITGLTELALNKRTGSPWFYFSLGKPVWRLAGGIALGALVVTAVATCYGLTALLLSLIASTALASLPAGHVIRGLSNTLYLLALEGGAIFLLVRFSFLLAPVTIAEECISLSRCWSLSHRNFWRIFVVFLALSPPILIVEAVSILFLVTRMHDLRFIAYPVIGLLVALFYGASAGAQAFAYHALTSAPVADDSLPD